MLTSPGGIWVENPCKPLAFLRDLRTFRIPYVFLLVQEQETKLKCYTRAILVCLKEAAPLLVLIGIQIFVFAHIGVILFTQLYHPYTTNGETLVPSDQIYMNFMKLEYAFTTLIVMCTGDAWTEIMTELQGEERDSWQRFLVTVY